MNEDEQFVKAFYHSQEPEKPSSELDAIVVSLARENMPIRSQWRKWQWPASIAASVMFVSVILFTQYTSFSPKLDDRVLSPNNEVDPFVLAQNATLDAQQQELLKNQRRQQEADILAKRSVQEQKAMADLKSISALKSKDEDVSTAESISQPELANYAQKEVATLAAKALDNIELDILPIELEESSAIDTGLKKASDIQIVASRKADIDMMSMTPAMMAEKQPEKIYNSDYLDELHTNFVVLKSQIDKLSDQNSNELKQLNLKLLEIRSTVFDHLKLLKLAEPTLKLQSRYLEMLNAKQQSLLVPEKIDD